MAARPVNRGAPPDTAPTRLAEIAGVVATDPPRAIALAMKARADGLSGTLVHHLAGLHLKESGQFEAAIVELGRGLELDPTNVVLMTLVGFCLLELGRRQEAAHVFEAALKTDPKSADAFYGYGWAAERLGALAQAKSAWERAVTLQPTHADALAGLSGLAVRARDWPTASDYAERAAALDHGQTDALMNLARVEMGLGHFDAAERRIRDLIDLPHLKPEARAAARIMLGDALDASGRYGEAFEAYNRGKGELRVIHAPTFEIPGARSATDAVHAMLAEFRDTSSSAWVRTTRSTGWPIHRGHGFLLGFPRSGTTLLEQVLASHPDVAALGERPALLKAELEFLTRFGGIARLAGVVSDSLEPFRSDYWRRVREFATDVRGKVFIDKQPLNTFRIPLIHKMFPEAKIIFAVRDPRDVVISCFRRNFNMNASMYEFNTIEGAARYYTAVMEAGEIYMNRLPVEVMRIRYEDLVRDFAEETRRLCDFLDIAWTAELEAFADTAGARMIATPSSTQVGRGLYEEGVDQWRHYAFALEPALPMLAPWIEKFGYAPT